MFWQCDVRCRANHFTFPVLFLFVSKGRVTSFFDSFLKGSGSQAPFPKGLMQLTRRKHSPKEIKQGNLNFLVIIIVFVRIINLKFSATHLFKF